MEKLKKSFHGYNVKAVEEMVEALEKELEDIKAQCELKERRMTEAQSIVDSANSQADEKNQEIERLRSELTGKERQIQELTVNANRRINEKEQEIIRLNTELSNAKQKPVIKPRESLYSKDENDILSNRIGNVYLKAYEAGSEIANDVRDKAEEFLQEIGRQSVEAQNGFKSTYSELDSVSSTAFGLVGQIEDQTREIREKINDLAGVFENYYSVYSQMEQISSTADENIRAVMSDYEESTKEFIRPITAEPEEKVDRRGLFSTVQDNEPKRTETTYNSFVKSNIETPILEKQQTVELDNTIKDDIVPDSINKPVDNDFLDKPIAAGEQGHDQNDNMTFINNETDNPPEQVPVDEKKEKTTVDSKNEDILMLLNRYTKVK